MSKLNNLKAGLHRVSFDIEVPEGIDVSLPQYVEAIKQVHAQLSNSLSHTSIGVDHVRNPLPKVSIGERVLIANRVDIVDSVYFSDGFHCGYHIPEEAVDLGKHKIAVKQGAYAIVNSISGSNINLIEISELGVISAYDPIKGKEISSQVQIHSCTVDLQNIKKIETLHTETSPANLDKCQCENSQCVQHNIGDCDNTTDGLNKAMYIGDICSECAGKMPEKYLTMVNGKSTERDA